MSNIQTIIARKKSCNCGCKCQDSWHKPSFKRAVSDVVAIDAIANVGFMPTMVAVAHGVAQFPWGREEVVGEVMSFDGKLFNYKIEWRLVDLRG